MAPRSLSERTVALGRVLRERGLPVTTAEVVDAVRALDVVDLRDRGELRRALRIVFLTCPEDGAAFDVAFDEIFPMAEVPASSGSAREPNRRGPRPLVPPAPARRGVPSLERWLRPAGDEEDAPGLRAPSADEVVGDPDARVLAAAGDLEAVARLARQLARRLARRPGRRWRAARRGARLDLRRTLRGVVRTGGDALLLARRARRIRKTKLVALCDVSGSMELYARFLIQFLYSLQNAFARVETFAFSTRLTRLTPVLREPTYRRMLAALPGAIPHWSGGTRIGDSLADFLERYGRTLDRRTVVLVMSDGWDTGDPERLGAAMAGIRARVGRVLWLNPLMADARFEPATRGMQAALPHVDELAPLHDLTTLEALARRLSR